jgi:glycine C-acetyltransferase
MYSAVRDQLAGELDDIRTAGLFKRERPLSSPQSSSITAGTDGARVLNFCANNYLGLADHPDIIAAAKAALDERGFGMASVRFICGTQDLHLELERRVSEFLGTEDTILFSSCFDANGGVFESLLGAEDAVISDALNHASIIDGIRLSKAQRFRYANRDMADLEAKLQEASGARRRLVVTDGVFSMDGYLAPLEAICDLAERYDAMVMVDDSHAVGFMGPTGAGTPEHAGVSDRVDIFTGTFGKALGGASGGYVAARREIVALLRQRARPYLFSNSLAPSIVAATLTALDLVQDSADLRSTLTANAALFRRRMTDEGFELLEGEHAIIPVMFGDAVLAARTADAMLAHGVFVTAFSYPVVPKGAARIRVQLSAAHTGEDVEACVRAFVAARGEVSGDQPDAADGAPGAHPGDGAQAPGLRVASEGGRPS